MGSIVRYRNPVDGIWLWLWRVMLDNVPRRHVEGTAGAEADSKQRLLNRQLAKMTMIRNGIHLQGNGRLLWRKEGFDYYYMTELLNALGSHFKLGSPSNQNTAT